MTHHALPYPIVSIHRWCLLLPSSWPYSLDNTISSGSSTGSASDCPKAAKFGPGPPASCQKPTDPNNLPKSHIETWFTRDVFEVRIPFDLVYKPLQDLFPFGNLGWGDSDCFPYSYSSFIIAARYFPNFGTSSPNTVYTAAQNARRDLAAFFAHAVQETGENNAALYGCVPQTTEFWERIMFQQQCVHSSSVQLFLPRRLLQLVRGRTYQFILGSKQSWVPAKGRGYL